MSNQFFQDRVTQLNAQNLNRLLRFEGEWDSNPNRRYNVSDMVRHNGRLFIRNSTAPEANPAPNLSGGSWNLIEATRAPTPPVGDNSDRIATTAFVRNSPAFTGSPTAPTLPNTNFSDRIATTAFVNNFVRSRIPISWERLGGSYPTTTHLWLNHSVSVGGVVIDLDGYKNVWVRMEPPNEDKELWVPECGCPRVPKCDCGIGYYVKVNPQIYWRLITQLNTNNPADRKTEFYY